MQQLFFIYKRLDTVGKATVLGTVISLISLVIAVFYKLVIEIPSPKPPIADPSGYQRMEGKWKLIDHVNTSKIYSYIGDEHLFELWLTVDNNRVSGKAEKIFYNEKNLPRAERSQLDISGTIHGDILKATFIEHGPSRQSTGRFILKFTDDYRSFRGSFESTAGDTNGESYGTWLHE